jgi:two-component system NtrC family sensor kinase
LKDVAGALSPSNKKNRVSTSLSRKVVLLLLLLFAVFACANFIIQRFVVYPSFVQLEQEDADKNVERALQAVQRDLDVLKPQVSDWANWDDTYQFVQDGNQEYIDANLYEGAVDLLGVNLQAFYDLDGKRVWAVGYDLNKAERLNADLFVPSVLPAQHPALLDALATEPVLGILPTPSGPMLFDAHPVLTSSFTGPAHGTVIFGRLLNAEAIAKIAEQSRIALTVKPPSAIDKSARVISSDAVLKLPHTAVTMDVSGKTLIGTSTLMDVLGNPAIELSIATPRTITARGQRAMLVANVSLGLAGLTVLLVILLLLRRTVFGPVSQLTDHVISVGREDDLSVQLNLQRNDEIGVLADEFDHMVAQLAQARNKLSDLSYQSGVAEMASGVLHNIGNAITPLGIKLTMLKQSLHDAPVEDMAMARAELADASTPADRRQDLQIFLDLAGDELGNLIKHMAHELEAMRTQVDHVQAALADQQRFSRAERLLEPLSIYRFLRDTLRLLPEPLQAFVQVEIDPALEHAPSVLVARIALQQVVNNLLINAAESIRESGKKADSGRIRIFAAQSSAAGAQQLDLCFQDNGLGIAAETVKHLFEKDFSTKLRGSGHGLHWSANTMSAMGGRILAESAGLGQGACMHLLLPLVAADKQEVE